MEKLKAKHDHKLTDIIKVCIFAIFLILPILCYIPTAFYYGFNEHADNGTQNTEIEYNYKFQTNDVNSYSDLLEGNIYHCEQLDLSRGLFYFDVDFAIQIYNGDFVWDTVNMIIDDYQDMDIQNKYLPICQLYVYYDEFNDNGSITLQIPNGDWLIDIDFIGTALQIFNCDFIITYKVNSFIEYYSDLYTIEDLSSSTFNYIESADIIYNNEGSIVNKMSDAWEQLWQTPMYKWTDNNNFQFTINAFTNVFGITQESYITNYINYLITLTAIYIVFDIILTMFKWLTHLIGEK